MRNHLFLVIAVLLMAMTVAGCTRTTESTSLSGLVRANFQTEHMGQPTDLYTQTVYHFTVK